VIVEDKILKFKGIWVIAEHANSELHEVTFEMLGEGRRLADKLGEELCCVLLGYNVAILKDSLAYYGADKVYIAEHQLLSQYSTDIYTAVLVNLICQYTPSIVIMGATSNGRDMAPRIAIRLKAGLMSNCVQLKINNKGVLEGTKPIYDGKLYGTVALLSNNLKIVTIIPGAIGVGSQDKSRNAQVTVTDLKLDANISRTKVQAVIKVDPKKLDIREPEIIVSGGRGVGGKEKWSIIEQLADSLRAGVGGSRAAMDMGCIKRENLVGQTGKKISPELYFSVGISGASQHLAGISGAKFILALNKDRFAPIVKSSNIAIIGDLHEIIPAILKNLDKIKDRNEVGLLEDVL
jgi:electron transfer flavoprotein alpha subunit